MSVMLYKKPGKHKIHGDMLDYVIVDESEVEETKKQGWFSTTSEAIDAFSDKDTMKKNLADKAKSLGIEFDGRTSTEKLETMVKQKLEEKAAAEKARIF